MNDLRTQLRDTSWRRRRRTLPTRLIDVTVAAVFAMIVTALTMRDPPRAPDVTIDNETPYDLTIKVSDGAGKSWMAFALVNAQSQTVVRSPIDQGSQWIISYGLGGEFPIDRSALQDAGWRIHVPNVVPERLAAAGVTASPRRSKP
ncbi:MAG: hypothetical protein ABIQ73_05760 [Acidimicrobiales bacterium]